MSPVQANCPGCGAQVVFAFDGAIVRVCQYCHSLIARADVGLQEIGKVALLVDTGSPLAIDTRGNFRGDRFVLTGRVQIAHPQGGVWNEWYAAFTDGRWGWLAEAQGKLLLMFEKQRDDLPALSQLAVGGSAGLEGLVVSEINQGMRVSAEGEIPFAFVPGSRFQYADLAGPNGRVGTLDYGDGTQAPTLHIGVETSFEELGIKVAREREARGEVQAKKLSCPHCGGALELHQPDGDGRIACPYCGALCDVTQGDLAFIGKIAESLKPPIPLGSRGELFGVKYTVIGALGRYVMFEGVSYPWVELLLFDQATGFRWLVCSDNHWSFVEPVSPGDVDYTWHARWKGKGFRTYQSAQAYVGAVVGEFYWKVSVGESVESTDYINPPHMLTSETSANEVVWSHSLYLDKQEVEKAFQADLPTPVTVAPHQPYRHKRVYLAWGLFILLLLLAGTGFLVGRTERFLHTENLTLGNLPPDPEVYFSEPFQVSGRKNLKVTANSSLVNNSWVYLEGDLINEETGLIQHFDLPIEYYAGYTDGESWSEGDQTPSTYVSAVPAGTYVLRIEVEREQKLRDGTLQVTIVQGAFHPSVWIWAFAFLSVIPLLTLLHHFSFEKRRWQDSDHAPELFSQGEDSE